MLAAKSSFAKKLVKGDMTTANNHYMTLSTAANVYSKQNKKAINVKNRCATLEARFNLNVYKFVSVNL